VISALPLGLVKVVAKAVWRDDEEDVELSSVALVDARPADLDTVRFELLLRPLDVGHQDRGAVLRRVAAVNGKPESNAVALEDDGRIRIGAPLDFGQAERRGVPSSRSATGSASTSF